MTTTRRRARLLAHSAAQSAENRESEAPTPPAAPASDAEPVLVSHCGPAVPAETVHQDAVHAMIFGESVASGTMAPAPTMAQALPAAVLINRKLHDIMRRLQSLESTSSANTGELKAMAATVDATMTTTRQLVVEEMTNAKCEVHAIRRIVEDVQKYVRLLDERRCLQRRQHREDMIRICHEIKLEGEKTRAERDHGMHILNSEIRALRKDLSSAQANKKPLSTKQLTRKRISIGEAGEPIEQGLPRSDALCSKKRRVQLPGALPGELIETGAVPPCAAMETPRTPELTDDIEDEPKDSPSGPNRQFSSSSLSTNWSTTGE